MLRDTAGSTPDAIFSGLAVSTPAPEGRRQVVALQHSAHSLVRNPEERAVERAVVTGLQVLQTGCLRPRSGNEGLRRPMLFRFLSRRAPRSASMIPCR